jgi:hypothetical protein
MSADEGDYLELLALTNQAAGTVHGNWVNVSGYAAGALWSAISALTAGSVTWSIDMSPDGGATVVTPVPTGELAAPAGISGVGNARYPFIGPMNQRFIRATAVVVTGPVTGGLFFAGRT